MSLTLADIHGMPPAFVRVRLLAAVCSCQLGHSGPHVSYFPGELTECQPELLAGLQRDSLAELPIKQVDGSGTVPSAAG